MQSRRHSLEETIVSTCVGLAVSTVLNHTIVPLILHAEVSAAQNVALTAIFTVASVLRGYFVRRHYNRKLVLQVRESLKPSQDDDAVSASR